MTAMVLLSIASLVASSDLPVAPAPRSEVVQRVRTCSFTGEVVAVNKQSITVRGHDPEMPGRDTIIRYFEANQALKQGKQDPREKSSSDYRLSDVEVGDKVYLILHPSGDDDICAAVRIRRRPGGLVPPAPFEDPDVRIPNHVILRAYQALEEKGIPLPPELDPNVREARDALARQDRATLMEYRMKVEKGLIAPPPRPVIR